LILADPANPSTSESVRAMQVAAWFRYGGKERLLTVADGESDYADALRALGKAVTTDPEKWATTRQATALRNACTARIKATVRAEDYFPLPDPQWQSVWTHLLRGIRKNSTDCQAGVDHADVFQLEDSAKDMNPIVEQFARLTDWVTTEVRTNNSL
jgi:hypothetical protein